MNWIASIFKMANQNWTSRIFTLVLIGLLTYSATTIFSAKAKVKCQDCTPYQKIAQDLIDAFKGKGITYDADNLINEYGFVNAVYYYDTVKPKPISKTEWVKYRDSVLMSAQRKIDSLKKQTKN